MKYLTDILHSQWLSSAVIACILWTVLLEPARFAGELPGLAFLFLFELLLFLQEFLLASAAMERNGPMFRELRTIMLYVYGLAALALNASLENLWPLAFFGVRALPVWTQRAASFNDLSQAESELIFSRGVRYGLLQLFLWGSSAALGAALGERLYPAAVFAGAAAEMSGSTGWFSPQAVSLLIFGGAVYFSALVPAHIFLLGDKGPLMAYWRREGMLSAKAAGEGGGGMEIMVRKAGPADEAEAAGWPVWEKEPSAFDWNYSEKEACLILEGEAEVRHPGGSVRFGAGDYVVFPQGLNCAWTITRRIRKRYRFG